MTIDRAIFETRKNIINIINNSGLSLRTISYILSELKQEADIKANEQLNEELKQEAEEMNKENSKEEE